MPETNRRTSLLTATAALVLAAAPASACGINFGAGGLALLAVLGALAVVVPLTIAVGGLRCSLSTAREGASLGRVLTMFAAWVLEGGLIWATGGRGSLAQACMTLAAAQALLLASGALPRQSPRPFEGRITYLTDTRF